MPKDANMPSIPKDTINQQKEVGGKQKNKRLMIKPNMQIITKNQYNLLHDKSEEECLNEDSCSGDKNQTINSITQNRKNKEKNYDPEKENFLMQRK